MWDRIKKGQKKTFLIFRQLTQSWECVRFISNCICIIFSLRRKMKLSSRIWINLTKKIENFMMGPQKCVVICPTPCYRTNSNINFRTLNQLKCVHKLVIEIKHPIFGFERSNIEPNRAFTRFTKLLIELTRTNPPYI